MELAFRKRFLLEHIQQLPKRDPSAFQMIYSQAVHMVTSGRLACSFQLAALFGALLINNTSGSYERCPRLKHTRTQHADIVAWRQAHHP